MQPFPVHTFDHSAKWAEAGRIKAHRSHITVVSFSPDRNYLASGDQDGYVLISRTNGWKHTFTVQTGGGGVRKLKWHPTKKSAFVVASSNGDINRVNFALSVPGSNRMVFTDTLIGNVPGMINAFDINADGSQVIIGFGGIVMALTMGSFENNSPASFSTVRSKEQRVVREVFYISREALGISYLIDEENVLSAYSTDVTHKFLWAIKKPLNRPFSHRIGGCAISPSGMAVAVMNLNEAIDFYYVPTRKLLLSVPFPQENLCASDLVFITENCVAVGGGDGHLSFVTMDEQDPSYVHWGEEIGPQFQTLTFMWREGRLFIASASATVSRGKPQVVVANKILPGDIDDPPPSIPHGNRNLEPTPAPEPNPIPAPVSLPVSDNGKILKLVIGSLSLLVVGVGIHYSCVLPTTKSASEIWQEFIHRFGYHEDFEDFPNLVPATTSDTTTTTTATTTTTVIMTRILRATDEAYRNSNGGGNHLLPALYALGFGSLGAIISTLLFIPANRTQVIAWFVSTTASLRAVLRPVALAYAEARNVRTNVAPAVATVTGGTTVAGRDNAISEGQVGNTAHEPPTTTVRPPAAAKPFVTAGVPVVAVDGSAGSADGSASSADGSAGSEDGPESWVAMGRGGVETG